MKISIDMECTASEAREFLGLPDVKPMQNVVMATLEKHAVQAAESFAPDAMLKLWFTTLPQMSSQFQEMVTRMLTNAAGRNGG